MKKSSLSTIEIKINESLSSSNPQSLVVVFLEIAIAHCSLYEKRHQVDFKVLFFHFFDFHQTLEIALQMPSFPHAIHDLA